MDWIKDLVVPILVGIIASGGFWSLLNTRKQKKSDQTQLLLGLAHDRITYLCLKYIRRGCIYLDEYENLKTHLYEPYLRLGGNSSTPQIMKRINELDIKSERIIDFKIKGEDK